MAVRLGNALSRGEDEQRDIGVGERALGLGLHPPGKRARDGLLEPGRVDDSETQIGDPSFTLAPVARDTGGIVDESNTPTDEPVEQGGFANIRAAENRDAKTHNGNSASAIV